MASRLSPARPLGATGVQVPIVGYGTAPLGQQKIPHDEGIRCLNHAIDVGITYLDTSPDYGSEPVVGEVMKSRRGEVFLATKINNRSRDGVLEQLGNSLQTLQTDRIDLIQVHAVNTWADLEQMIAPDGALAGLKQARDEGLVRFIGVTGHARPDVLREALLRFPFDTVLVAAGMADRLVSAPDTVLLPTAVERKVGVIAMKVFGHGVFRSRDLALRYSLGLPGVSLAILGLNNTQQIDEAVETAQHFRPLDEREEERLIDEVRPIVEKDAKEYKNGQSDLFWLHDTTVMGWQEHDEPVLVEY